MNDEELVYSLALGMVPGIGPVTARKLISFCGSATEVFRFPARDLRRIPGIGPRISQAVRVNRPVQRAEKELSYCRENAIDILLYHESRFPGNLLHCPDSPYMLFVKGVLPRSYSRAVAVVGSRQATHLGKKAVEEIVASLRISCSSVISGLALGIDAHAHRCSLEYGVPTIAVLAHGLDRVYPFEHRGLAKRISSGGGALVTEYPSGTMPEKMHFPARNRIVAGLSSAVVVVESARKGGALITADIANSYNRDVFAVPGRWSDDRSAGCNDLIRHHKAALLAGGNDLLLQMGWNEGETAARSGSGKGPGGLEGRILTAIQNEDEPVHIDVLAELFSGDPACAGQSLMGCLLGMEMDGWIRTVPGNRFAKA
jgi:DNA processing protein